MKKSKNINNLKQCREGAGMKREMLASKLRISPRTLEGYEQNRHNIPKWHRRKFKQLFHDFEVKHTHEETD